MFVNMIKYKHTFGKSFNFEETYNEVIKSIYHDSIIILREEYSKGHHPGRAHYFYNESIQRAQQFKNAYADPFTPLWGECTSIEMKHNMLFDMAVNQFCMLAGIDENRGLANMIEE